MASSFNFLPMKKTAFFVLAILSIIWAIRILSIVFTDLSRLTTYGQGYLIGQVLLFSLFLFGAVWLFRKIVKLPHTL